MTLPDVLRELEIEFAEAGQSRHVTAGWLGLDCPRCSPGEQKYKLGVNIAGGWASCWSCGYQNTAVVLAEISGRPINRVRELLGDFDQSDRLARPEAAGRVLIPTGVEPLPESHRWYLERRGFRDVEQLIRLWGVQGIGRSAALAWRLFIPIVQSGKVVSWTTRALSDAVASRYVSAKPEQEAAAAKSVLYGADHARHAIIVVEGPLDAWRIGPGAVATLGTGYSRSQLLAMSRYPLRAVVFDREPEAQERAKKLCRELADFPGKTARVRLDSKDPGSASGREIHQLRREFLE